jgi:hypothetical protein
MAETAGIGSCGGVLVYNGGSALPALTMLRGKTKPPDFNRRKLFV